MNPGLRRIASIFLVLSLAGAAAPTPVLAHTSSAHQQRVLRAQERGIKARLRRLKRSLAKSEAAHAEASGALAAAERAISKTNRHLHRLAAQRQATERKIADLQRREAVLAAAQSTHEAGLAVSAREAFALSQLPALELAIDPAQSWIDMSDRAYLDALIRRQAQRIRDLRSRRSDLADIEAESRARSAELQQIADDERTSRARLLKEEKTRRAVLAKLAKQISMQRRSVASLEHDDARLAHLIDRLGRLLAGRHRRSPRTGPHGGRPVENLAALEHFEPPRGAAFSRLRGRLLLPVAGAIVSRFGAPRLDDAGHPQAGAPVWKGILIRAPAGAEVHAVAAGRVVYADWLRGFGNLLIVDHGNGFLSVYADNESLLRNLGDKVRSDEVVALVGDTGENRQSGLYFEMRYRGRPFDPLKWAHAR